jgi:hypothetical protein
LSAPPVACAIQVPSLARSTGSSAVTRPLGGPLRRGRIPQTRLFLGCRARHVQTGRQTGHLAGERTKDLFLGRLCGSGGVSGAQIVQPLRHMAQRLPQTPADDQKRHAHDQQGLRHAEQRMPPDRGRDEGHVVEDGDGSQQAAIGAEGQRQNVHRRIARAEELPAHASL